MPNKKIGQIIQNMGPENVNKYKRPKQEASHGGHINEIVDFHPSRLQEMIVSNFQSQDIVNPN